jgi:hypothetical protein
MLQHNQDSSSNSNNCPHHRPELSYIPISILKHHCEIYGTIDHVSRTLILIHFATPKKDFEILHGGKIIFYQRFSFSSPELLFFLALITKKICLHKNFPDILYRPQFITDYVYKYLPKQNRYLRVISSWRRTFFMRTHLCEKTAHLLAIDEAKISFHFSI